MIIYSVIPIPRTESHKGWLYVRENESEGLFMYLFRAAPQGGRKARLGKSKIHKHTHVVLVGRSELVELLDGQAPESRKLYIVSRWIDEVEPNTSQTSGPIHWPVRPVTDRPGGPRVTCGRPFLIRFYAIWMGRFRARIWMELWAERRRAVNIAASVSISVIN